MRYDIEYITLIQDVMLYTRASDFLSPTRNQPTYIPQFLLGSALISRMTQNDFENTQFAYKSAELSPMRIKSE